MVEAIKQQADRLCTVAPSMANDMRSEAARLITERAPGDLDKVFFTNGGTEGIENAMRLAKGHTGRLKVLSMYRSYHGATMGSITITGEPRRLDNEPGMPGAVKFFGPYLYRYRAGRFSVVGTDLGIDLFALAGKQAGERIHVDATATAGGPTWPNACHVCEVEVDPDSGDVQVVSYASVNDIGRVVSPAIVRGQVEGGAVQGIGQALWERIVYDDDSSQLVTGSFMDYAMPRAEGLPEFRTQFDTSIPCLTNPLGVKGVGELGTIGATPAVMNAVADALAHAGARRGAERDPDAGDLGAGLAGAAGRNLAAAASVDGLAAAMDRRSFLGCAGLALSGCAATSGDAPRGAGPVPLAAFARAVRAPARRRCRIT